MKRIVSLFLVCSLLLTGCTPAARQPQKTPASAQEVSAEQDTPSQEPEASPESAAFSGPEDPALLQNLEDSVYSDLVFRLDSDAYFVENVEAIYVSKEYLDETAYNTQANVYFGYTLEELDALFQGTRYVFTLGENGQTVIEAFTAYDETYDRAIRNVAIGTGVILICVTVSVVSGAMGASAVSLIFAASAETGVVAALSDGLLSGVAAGVVTGIQTQDFDQALKAAALAGSEAFKWGALIGVLSGGVEKAVALRGAASNGLTVNQAAAIQQESGLPLDFIKSFHSMDEYELYKKAGLQASKINSKWAFTRDIDWDFIGDAEDGRTNAQRVMDGLAPLESTGKPYELHHIGQKTDSPLAILTSSEHRSSETNKILHTNTGSSVSEVEHGAVWLQQKQEFWKSLLEQALGG